MANRNRHGYGYDPRLDSKDVIQRQQAEIEALRTCLIASNSESSGEYSRLRLQVEALADSYEGQKRNTFAFMRERDEAREALRTAREVLLFRMESNGYVPTDVLAAIHKADAALGQEPTALLTTAEI
jgi:hypothetical protein